MGRPGPTPTQRLLDRRRFKLGQRFLRAHPSELQDLEGTHSLRERWEVPGSAMRVRRLRNHPLEGREGLGRPSDTNDRLLARRTAEREFDGQTTSADSPRQTRLEEVENLPYAYRGPAGFPSKVANEIGRDAALAEYHYSRTDPDHRERGCGILPQAVPGPSWSGPSRRSHLTRDFTAPTPNSSSALSGTADPTTAQPPQFARIPRRGAPFSRIQPQRHPSSTRTVWLASFSREASAGRLAGSPEIRTSRSRLGRRAEC